MPILGTDRTDLGYRQEEGTRTLRAFVESTIVSNSPEVDRITRYALYWNFYNGQHWRQHNSTFLAFNYVRAFINKTNSFLLGKTAFSHVVTRYDGAEVTEEQESAVESFFDYHWNKSRKVLTAYKILQMGSVCGDAWAMPTWDAEGKYVKINVLDSRYCFPEFKNGDTNNLVAFEVRQPLGANDKQYSVMVTRITKEKFETWFQKNTAISQVKKEDVTSTPNPYKVIPIVHFTNIPSSDSYYAPSDMQDILKINKVYNEQAQQIKSVIDYYGTPTTVVTGGSIRTITKGLGQIWSGLPAEANVFNLGLGEDLAGSMNFLTLLKTSMHELSDVPENALGKLQAISNTSAAALQITYQPLIQQADRKGLCYGEGIAELNGHIYTVHKYHEPANELLKKLPKDFATGYECHPVFPYGLPQDRLSEMNLATSELQARVASRREIMNRMGKRNVPALLAEIDTELAERARMEALATGGIPDESAGTGGENLPEAE